MYYLQSCLDVTLAVAGKTTCFNEGKHYAPGLNQRYSLSQGQTLPESSLAPLKQIRHTYINIYLSLAHDAGYAWI